MNTKIIGVTVAVILLLGAGGAYFLSQNKTAIQTNVVSTPTVTENKTSSLLDLLNLGKNQQCTFKTTTSGSKTEGTFYIAQGKMRGDLKTTVDGKEQEMSMIRDGDMNYIWGSSLTTGIKMKLSLDEISSNKQTSQYINTSDKLNYDCKDWRVDSSLFTPPVDIKFTDLSAMMEKTKETTKTTPNTSVCDAIEDEAAKASCIKALSNQ